MKRCSCCKDDKELKFFGKDSKSLDGHQSWCKSCKSEALNEYYKNNPSKRTKVSRTKEQSRQRYFLNKVNYNVSRQIRKVLKVVGGKNGRSWEKLVGYTLAELRTHLEAKFKKGMTWDNYGSWHIDHERPISSFNIKGVACDDFKNCWALSNLQPLWAEENLSKSNRF